MLNILVNAYAVSPTKGSEPGVGWNWVVNLARYCNVYVITEGEWKQDILEAVTKLPQRDNLHFYFNPVSAKIRKMCWNQGDWRFYWFYRQWQKKTFKIAQRIVRTNNIKIIHQLNMIGFREPGYLWKIGHVPFVWGPVGGMELMPLNYLSGGTFKEKGKFLIKNVINNWQRHHQSRLISALNHADSILAATKGVYDVIRDYHRKDVVMMNETGCYVQSNNLEDLNNYQLSEFNILWAGRFLFSKQLGLALKIIASLKKSHRIRFHIIGTGTKNEVEKYHKLATHLGIDKLVIWHGQILHDEVLNLMKSSHILLFTSVMEGTPHVVLEAIQSSLPIICFDACGQAGVVNDKIGIKIPLSNTAQSVKDFVVAIEQLINSPKRLATMRANCLIRQTELSWDNKARQMIGIYNEILNNERARHQH